MVRRDMGAGGKAKLCRALGFWLAGRIMDNAGCPVYALHAAKLAWTLHRLPPEELPVVPFPGGEEEERRAIISELHSKKWARNMLVNRLHSLFIRGGPENPKEEEESRNRFLTISSLSPGSQGFYYHITTSEEARVEINISNY